MCSRYVQPVHDDRILRIRHAGRADAALRPVGLDAGRGRSRFWTLRSRWCRCT